MIEHILDRIEMRVENNVYNDSILTMEWNTLFVLILVRLVSWAILDATTL